LSLNFRNALFAQESSEIAIFLLTITHPSLVSPILLSSDPTTRLTTDPLVYGTTSRSNNYLYVGMQVQLPSERDKSPPATQMTISNVDRSIIPLIRSISSPASVKIEGVLASAPDTVEFTMPVLEIATADFNAETITFDLLMDSFATEPFPSGSFSPAYFPGLFA
jgi:hypothetical protein